MFVCCIPSVSGFSKGGWIQSQCETNREIDRKRITISFRDEKLISLSQILFQLPLQWLQIATFRVRVVTHDDSAIFGHSVENDMVAQFPWQVEIRLHVLFATVWPSLHWEQSLRNPHRPLRCERESRVGGSSRWNETWNTTASCTWGISKWLFTRAISCSIVGWGLQKVAIRPIPNSGLRLSGVRGTLLWSLPNPSTIQSFTPPFDASEAVWGE